MSRPNGPIPFSSKARENFDRILGHCENVPHPLGAAEEPVAITKENVIEYLQGAADALNDQPLHLERILLAHWAVLANFDIINEQLCGGHYASAEEFIEKCDAGKVFASICPERIGPIGQFPLVLCRDVEFDGAITSFGLGMDVSSADPDGTLIMEIKEPDGD